MSEWKARRFWASVAIHDEADGWSVLLDERPLRTPGKQPLRLPTEALALAVAQEWQAVQEVIDPNAMPLTRAANSAIEKVVPQFDAVAAMLGDYGGTDLLSYRADAPEALVRAQAEGWDPLIDWAATELRAPLRITHGVIPVPGSGRAAEIARRGRGPGSLWPDGPARSGDSARLADPGAGGDPRPD